MGDDGGHRRRFGGGQRPQSGTVCRDKQHRIRGRTITDLNEQLVLPTRDHGEEILDSGLRSVISSGKMSSCRTLIT